MAVVGPLLLERDAELERVSASLEAVREGRGSVVVIEAGAGLGKTQFLGAACDQARDSGMEVLSARGSELERESPFGVLRQAFGPLVACADRADLDELLRGPARLAAGLLLGSDLSETIPGQGESDLAPALLHSLYWLLSNLAERHPVLIAFDDAHWCDAQSLRFVISLLPRLGELPVSIFLAMRQVGGEAPAGSALTPRIVSESVTELLTLRPLSEEAVALLVDHDLSGEASAEFSSAVHQATAGNPFFVRELLREVTRERVLPSDEGAARVRDLVPSKVARAVLLHLGRLAPEAPQIAKAAAILGDRAEPRHVAALAEVNESRVTEVADAMIRAGILADEPHVSFSHPIVRSAVAADMGVHERSDTHRRAAGLLWLSQFDPAVVAAHLLEATPGNEPSAVEALRAAARVAIERGAPAAAALYLRRAQVEPPPEEKRAEVALELGTAEALAGEPTAAESLTTALEFARDPKVRGRAALGLGRGALLAGDSGRAVALTQQAIGEFETVDPQLALMTRAELINARLFRASTAPLAHVEAAALQVEAERLGPPGSWHALACLASLRAIEGAPPDEVAQLAERGLANGQLVASVGAEAAIVHLPTFALMFVDRFEFARQAAGAALADARRRGSPLGFLHGSWIRSHLFYRMGRLREAEADARAALDIAVEMPPGLVVLVARAFLADVLLERGESQEAFDAVAGFTPPPRSGGIVNHILHTRGRVLIHLGRPEEALADLLACGAGNDGIGAVNPGTIPWRSAAAEAMLALGDEAGACRLASEELARARRFGAPRSVGMALLAHGRSESGSRRLELLGESVAVLRNSGARLEHARALVELGASLRRANQRHAAREPLVEGLELARECGATVLEQRAGEELRATGARPRKLVYTGVDSLTASELRVATAAADGQSNPEIAQALFVTRKTIEAHLSSAYAKLDISSRRELSRALSAS